MKRVHAEEWLDEDSGSSAEVQSALRSLRWVNVLFGGNRTHTALLRRAIRRAGLERFTLLEVASGEARSLQAALRACARRTPATEVLLLDRSAQHLPAGPGQWLPALPAPALLCGDALAIPLRDNSVDFVASCLFLHHLTEEETCMHLREALRVARVAVLINDLERSVVHYALSRMASILDPSRISSHDGPVSVRRAYTRGELGRLLRGLGARFEIRRGFLFRMGVIVWKRPS